MQIIYYIIPVLLLVLYHVYRTKLLKYSAKSFTYLLWVLAAWLLAALVGIPLVMLSGALAEWIMATAHIQLDFMKALVILPINLISAVFEAVLQVTVVSILLMKRPSFSALSRSFKICMKKAFLPLLLVGVAFALVGLAAAFLPPVLGTISSILKEICITLTALYFGWKTKPQKKKEEEQSCS